MDFYLKSQYYNVAYSFPICLLVISATIKWAIQFTSLSVRAGVVCPTMLRGEPSTPTKLWPHQVSNVWEVDKDIFLMISLLCNDTGDPVSIKNWTLHWLTVAGT